MTYNGSLAATSRMRIHVYGVDRTDDTDSVELGTTVGISPVTILIGDSGVPGEEYDGTIDDVRVYNRALSPTEVKQALPTPHRHHQTIARHRHDRSALRTAAVRGTETRLSVNGVSNARNAAPMSGQHS